MTGYDRLASLMGMHPELQTFRKFGVLGVRMLLYKQAELLHLENDLAVIVAEDNTAPQFPSSGASWYEMHTAPSTEGANMQALKVQEIQDKLDKYYFTMLLVNQVHKMPGPRPYHLSFLRDWLDLPQCGAFFLKGVEADAWEEKYTDDLAALSPADSDHLADFLIRKLVPSYHRHFGHLGKPVDNEELGRRWEYKTEFFVLLGNLLCMLLSWLIPTTSIFVLYIVTSMLGRLVWITGMTFVFSLIMTFVAHGRRVDVFAATTAFAAVQVVYVGGVNYITQYCQPNPN